MFLIIFEDGSIYKMKELNGEMIKNYNNTHSFIIYDIIDMKNDKISMGYDDENNIIWSDIETIKDLSKFND
jgi:hypothetical protein